MKRENAGDAGVEILGVNDAAKYNFSKFYALMTRKPPYCRRAS